MFLIIDCGTTNTRVYILDDSSNIIGKGYKKIGVRDTAITGSNQVLKDGIKEAFYTALENSNTKLENIDFAIASGMITSEIGLIDIPHLIAPVGKDDLAKNVKIVHDSDIFPFDIPVIFIRGIKNNYGNADLEEIRSIDFLRGEETQVVGVLNQLKSHLPLNIIFLSSHTKLIHINSEGKIAGSITTISGQIYEAIKKETYIGKCIAEDKTDDQDDFFSERILGIARDSVINVGFIRTLLMPRFMQVLLSTNWYERRFFVDSAIAVEDMKILKDAENILGFDLNTDFILIGQKERCKIYEYLINSIFSFDKNILCITDKEEIDMLTINGAIQIAKASGYRIKVHEIKS